ncbi:acyltransferase [Clostridium perfringens]|nr:acyltransferase [Clostridium perfringens]EGT0686551.1 acyltransferase [Clostridium perfringens]MDG6877450.1 Maltose O-acetyltransferase [Clostridium perfringens]MDH5081811.1 Maltose O-acetyltransferase [Clostridium perfringens]OUP45095.1 hypothetical protein B5F20_11955 [Clostridium perfringens]
MGYIKRIKIKIRSILRKQRLNHYKNVKINGKLTLETYSNIFPDSDASLTIGSLFMNSYSSITVKNNVQIGYNVMFGENVHVYDHNHIFTNKTMPFSRQGYKLKKVSIGDNCWIGTGTVILGGAQIGNNCVVGANCIIDFHIPDNSIVKNNSELRIEKINFK